MYYLLSNLEKNEVTKLFISLIKIKTTKQEQMLYEHDYKMLHMNLFSNYLNYEEIIIQSSMYTLNQYILEFNIYIKQKCICLIMSDFCNELISLEIKFNVDMVQYYE